MTDAPLASLSIVALISARGGGDWPSVVAVAVGLHNRGHAVSLVCDGGTEGAVRATGLPIISVPPTLEQPDIRLAIARSPEIGPQSPNPLVEWAQICGPAIRPHIQSLKPSILLSSLLCMGLADQLASELGIPWCFVNPSFYFGEDSARPWEGDFLGVSIGTFRYWFQPLLHRASSARHRCRIRRATHSPAGASSLCRSLALGAPCFCTRIPTHTWCALGAGVSEHTAANRRNSHCAGCHSRTQARGRTGTCDSRTRTSGRAWQDAGQRALRRLCSA